MSVYAPASVQDLKDALLKWWENEAPKARVEIGKRRVDRTERDIEATGSVGCDPRPRGVTARKTHRGHAGCHLGSGPRAGNVILERVGR